MSVTVSTLDDILNRYEALSDPVTEFHTGSTKLDRICTIRRGGVVEFSGPPGSGKTTIALSAAIDALNRSHKVCWLSLSGRQVPITRMAKINGFRRGRLKAFSHAFIDSFSQLYKLLTSDCIPESTGLIVVDGVWTVLPGGGETRRAALVALTAVMKQFARHKNIALVLLNTMKTYSMDNGTSLGLLPALEYGRQWEGNLDARVVLYRDAVDLSSDQLWKEELVERASEVRVHARAVGGTDMVILDIGTRGISDYSRLDQTSQVDPTEGVPANKVHSSDEESANPVDSTNEEPTNHLNSINQEPANHLDSINQQPTNHLNSINQQPTNHLDSINQEPSSTNQAIPINKLLSTDQAAFESERPRENQGVRDENLDPKYENLDQKRPNKFQSPPEADAAKRRRIEGHEIPNSQAWESPLESDE